eukprot:3749658-Amphidinium_carterae.1
MFAPELASKMEKALHRVSPSMISHEVTEVWYNARGHESLIGCTLRGRTLSSRPLFVPEGNLSQSGRRGDKELRLEAILDE